MSDNFKDKKIYKYSASLKTQQILNNVSSDYTKLKYNFEDTLAEVKAGINLHREIPKTDNCLSCENFDGKKIYTLQKDNTYEKVLVYFHGGGYLYGLDPLQIKLCDKICSTTNCKVYILDYGLPYKYSCIDAFEYLDFCYKKVLQENKRIIFMGDSSGGGLALAYIQYLEQENAKIPHSQILISPWLDVTMSNKDCLEYEKDDAFLGIDGLRAAGKIWAKNLDTRDYRLSPMFGNFANMPKTLLITGTKDVMYPDILKLYDKLIYNSRDVRLVICEGSFHVYPFWDVPEAQEALTIITKLINN